LIDDSLSLEYYKEQDEQTPWTAQSDVEFEAPVLAINGESEEPQSPAALGVAVVDATQQLDPNDMTMKTITANEIAVANQEELQKYVILSVENITKDELTTFGLGNYSGWRTDMVTSKNDIVYGNSCCLYHIDIFSVTGDKVYKISGFAREIVAERYLPILQKMIDSFHITAK
jgi:hypothetical protein